MTHANLEDCNVFDLFPHCRDTEYDPLHDPAAKRLIADYYSGGSVYIFPNDPHHKTHSHIEYWAEDLPEELQQAYGLCAAVTLSRAPRERNTHTHALYNNYRFVRYLQVICCAWANELPLTENMHKHLFNGYHQEVHPQFMGMVRTADLITENVEDWRHMPYLHEKTTEGLHIRPSRAMLYLSIDAAAHVLSALHGSYNRNKDFLENAIERPWSPKTKAVPQINPVRKTDDISSN